MSNEGKKSHPIYHLSSFCEQDRCDKRQLQSYIRLVLTIKTKKFCVKANRQLVIQAIRDIGHNLVNMFVDQNDCVCMNSFLFCFTHYWRYHVWKELQ